MASTGAKLPTSGTSVSASPWSDDAWTSPGNVTAIDSTYASVTASTFDTNDQTHRLRCVGFDFSSIPDGSTINGISVTIHNARYANGSGSIDLAQLVEGGTPLGNNKYATPQALTTTATTDYSLGGTSDLWGATLTPAIVKSATFGIDLGCLSTAANTDVFIDAVEMTVEYTAPVTTITLTPSSDSVAPGEYAIFTATVSLDGTPTSGQTVTASSSSTGTAVVLVADEQASSGDMTWRNNSVPSPTYSAPGGTSPLGATIRRFTEAAATTYHQGGWSAIDHTNMAAGDKIIVVLEVKVTNATAVAIGSYSNTDGTVAYNAALNPANGTTATGASYGTINSSTTADLGSGWWLWIVEYTYAAGSDGSMLPSVALSNTTTATIPSYAGNTSNYMDIGVCTIYVQRASPSTTTTDGSGEQLIFVRGVAAGTSDITATANSVTSSASALTVATGTTISVPKASLTLTGYAPTVAATANVWAAVPAGSLSLTGYAPTVIAQDAKTVSVPAASLTISAQTPTVATTENVLVEPPAGSLALAAYAPTVAATANVWIEPPAASLSLAAQTPTVEATADVWVDVPGASLTLAGYAPAILNENASAGQGGDPAFLPHIGLLLGANASIAVPTTSLALTAYAPTVAATAHVWVDVPAAALVLTSYAPTVQADASVSIDVPAAAIEVTGYAPTLATTANVAVDVPAASLELTGYAPTVSADGGTIVSVPFSSLELTLHAPTIVTPRVVSIPEAVLELVAYAPTIITPRLIDVPSTSLTLTSFAPEVHTTAVIEVPATSLTITGYAPSVDAGSGGGVASTRVTWG